MGNGILNFKRVAVIYDDSFLLSRFERESGGERKKKSVWNWAGPAPFRSYFADSLSTRKERAISPTTAWQIVIFQFPPSIFPHDWEKERETGKKKKEKKKSLCLPSSSFGNRFAYLGTAQRKKRRPRVIVVIYSSPTEPGSRALAFLPFLVHLGPSSLFYSGS